MTWFMYHMRLKYWTQSIFEQELTLEIEQLGNNGELDNIVGLGLPMSIPIWQLCQKAQFSYAYPRAKG